jgi:hypothetical protein
MASITIDACLSIKTNLQRRARNVALEQYRRSAIAAQPEPDNNMTANAVRAAFGAGTAVTLRQPFKDCALIEATNRRSGVVASEKIVA